MGALYKEESDQEQVQILRVKDGRIRTLLKIDGLQLILSPIGSPDGTLVAMAYDIDDPMYHSLTSLVLVSNDVNPETIRLTQDLKLLAPKWSRDGSLLYALQEHGPYTQIVAVDLKTRALIQITNGPVDIDCFDISPDGSHIAWVGKDAQSTHFIQSASNRGENVKDLAVVSDVSSEMALGEVRKIEWNVPDYPSPMSGLLILPLNYQQGVRYPLIVNVHGGGAGNVFSFAGSILSSTPLEWHLWSAKGYMVFVPEFRSSGSFGSLAFTRDEKTNFDLINCDTKDIVAGVDALVGGGFVDQRFVIAMGHSAGARRMNWISATNHHFRAVISNEGWADEWIQAMNTEPFCKRTSSSFGGAPWEVPQNYQKNSALFHCRGASTPTLFLMGNPDLGGHDPFNTVKILFNSLRDQGVETEYVKYEDEGHWLEKRENQRDALERSMRWVEKHFSVE
jgi:dipeptidyl aminopeptidase/acylaminoacyl peptidase